MPKFKPRMVTNTLAAFTPSLIFNPNEIIGIRATTPDNSAVLLRGAPEPYTVPFAIVDFVLILRELKDNPDEQRNPTKANRGSDLRARSRS